MELISAKKKKSVPVAEKQPSEVSKPEVPVSPEPVPVASKEEAPTASVEEVSKLIEIPEIDEDTRKMLLKAGFKWDQIVGAFEKINIWAESVDGRFTLIGNALEKMPTNEGIAEELRKKLQAAAQQAQAQQAQAQTQAGSTQGGGGMGIGQIMGIVDKVLGSESSNPLQEKMNKFFGAVLDKQLESINKPSRFEALLDEELMKAKAKAIAAVVTSPG